VELVKQSTLYVFARGIPGLVNLLAIALFTRLYNANDYGRYVLVLSTIALVNAILFQWLRLGLLRFMTVYREQRETFLATILAGFIAITGISAVMACMLMIFFMDSISPWLLLFGLLMLWLEAFFELNQELARSELSPRRYGLFALLRTLTLLAVGGFLGYLGFGAYGLLSGAVVSMALPVSIQLRSNFGAIKNLTVDREILLQLYRYGLPLTATFALGYVVSSSDRLLIGWLLGPRETGLYAVGYDLAKQGIGIMLTIINLAAYPLAVNALEREGVAGARQQLEQNLLLILAVVCPVTTGLSLLAPNICHVLIGSEFRETAAQLIPWVAFGSMLAGIKAFYFDLSFQLGRRTLGQVWVVLIAALVNFFLNLWWIPMWGLMGSAYATAAAYGVALLMSWRLGRDIMALPLPLLNMVKILFATIVMSLALFPIRHFLGVAELVGQILLGAMIFAIMLWVMNIASIRSRMPLRSCRSFLFLWLKN